MDLNKTLVSFNVSDDTDDSLMAQDGELAPIMPANEGELAPVVPRTDGSGSSSAGPSSEPYKSAEEPAFTNEVLPSFEAWELGFGPSHQSDCPVEFGDADAGHIDRLVRSKFIDVVGRDRLGRMIVTIAACLMPNLSNLSPETLFKFLVYTMGKFGDATYTLIYFHGGQDNTEAFPAVRWLTTCYRDLDKKYRKNIHRLYLVHPTFTLKGIWAMAQACTSSKFHKKVFFANYLHEVEINAAFELPVPPQVKEHDRRQLDKNPRAAAKAATLARLAAPSTAQPGPSQAP